MDSDRRGVCSGNAGIRDYPAPLDPLSCSTTLEWEFLGSLSDPTKSPLTPSGLIHELFPVNICAPRFPRNSWCLLQARHAARGREGIATRSHLHLPEQTPNFPWHPGGPLGSRGCGHVLLEESFSSVFVINSFLPPRPPAKSQLYPWLPTPPRL